MDSQYWDATMRHKLPKAKPGPGQNGLERQLRANPFAKALATPLRQCNATRTQLPNYFLQDFHLVSHPETDRPWWVPHSLMREEPSDNPETDEPTEFDDFDALALDEEASVGAEAATGGADELDIKLDAGNTKLKPGQPHPSQPRGPGIYVLARQALISAMTEDDKNRGYKGLTKRLYALTTTSYSKLSRGAVWRKEMDIFIRDQMQKEIIEDLLYLSKLVTEDDRFYIVKCHGWEDVQYKHKGALLWFEDEASKAEATPGPFATYEYEKDGAPTAMVIHNLSLLLGTDGARKVKEEGAVFRDGFLFALARRRTVDLQMKLWRLQAYLFDPISEPTR
ncbi:hypothetical protein F5Y16DRAFT_396658 [Xylariaceae sp. FL0255]|nr:hypothetical protein F5Y16DRAFT_396658 [Xylariaceae sp. FL0255]